jgi:hypothetical protein
LHLQLLPRARLLLLLLLLLMMMLLLLHACQLLPQAIGKQLHQPGVAVRQLQLQAIGFCLKARKIIASFGPFYTVPPSLQRNTLTGNIASEVHCLKRQGCK